MEVKEQMADLKGTQTEKNLLAAFAGESQAAQRWRGGSWSAIAWKMSKSFSV